MDLDNPKRKNPSKPQTQTRATKNSQPDVKAVSFAIKLPCTNSSAKKQILNNVWQAGKLAQNCYINSF